MGGFLDVLGPVGGALLGNLIFPGIGGIAGGALAGGALSSLGGGTGLTGQRQNQTVTLDPTTQALNLLRLRELENAFGATAGLPGLFSSIRGTAEVSPQTQRILDQATRYAQEPGLSTEDFYNRTLAGLDPSFSLASARNIFDRLYAPEIQNNFSLMGLGRSGGVQEARAKALSGLALPISQQQLQNLFSLNQQLPNVDIALRQARLGRLGTGAGFSDFPQGLRRGAEQSILQGYLTNLTSTPYTPAPSTSGRTDTGLLTSILGSGVGTGLGQAAGTYGGLRLAGLI